jgi:HAMP domain-containing protein
LYVLLVRPVRRIVRTADRLSVGDLAAEEFPPNGPSEIASLVRSFNRMRTSLDKAMRLLDRSA